jgi:hypothetical protein
MLLAKQFEFAQQMFIICSKGCTKIIESFELFNFISLFIKHSFLLMD